MNNKKNEWRKEDENTLEFVPAAIFVCLRGSPLRVLGAETSKYGLSVGWKTLIILATWGNHIRGRRHREW